MTWYEKKDLVNEIQWKQTILTLKFGNMLCLIMLFSYKYKTKIQSYHRILISLYNTSRNNIIRVRRFYSKIRIEQIFIFNSIVLKDVQIERFSKVRRIKLYYLRNRWGKVIKLQIRFVKISVIFN